jgi:hypothetical protein
LIPLRDCGCSTFGSWFDRAFLSIVEGLTTNRRSGNGINHLPFVLTLQLAQDYQD